MRDKCVTMRDNSSFADDYGGVTSMRDYSSFADDYGGVTSMVMKSTTFMSNLGFHIPWLSLRLKKVFDSERSMATETNEGGGDECVVTEMNENC